MPLDPNFFRATFDDPLDPHGSRPRLTEDDWAERRRRHDWDSVPPYPDRAVKTLAAVLLVASAIIMLFIGYGLWRNW